MNVFLLVWVYQYLLRRIQPEEFAVYAVVTAVMVFAPLFSSFLASGISRYVVEACARDDEVGATRIVSSIFPLLLAWGLLFIAGGWYFAWNIGAVLKVTPEHLNEARVMMGLLVTDFAIQIIIAPFTVGFHVHQRFLLLNLIQIGVTLYRMGILFILLFGVSTSVIWVVVATTSSNLLLAILTTIISRKILPSLRYRPNLFQWQTTRKLVSFGFWTTIGQLAYMIYMNVDIIVLNKLSSAFEVTVFKLGSDIFNQIQILVTSSIVPILPTLTAFHARKATDSLGDAFVRGGRYTLWATLFLACPIFVYRRELITLYVGAGYLEVATVLALLFCMFPLIQSTLFLAPIAEATARVRRFYLAFFVVQLVKLAVTLYLVMQLKFGAVGCAISTLVVNGLACLFVFMPMAFRMTGVGLKRHLKGVLFRGLLPAAAGLTVLMLLKEGMQPMSWGAIGLNILAGSVAYLAVLILFSASDGDQRDMLAVWHGLTRRWGFG
jgi:O-antigen/teichoic acid export membrane protein